MPRTNEEIKKNRPSDRKADQQIDVILFLFLSSTVTPPSYFFNEAFVFFSSCGRSNTAGLHPNQK